MIDLPATVDLAPPDQGKRVEKVLVRALPGAKESFLLMLVHRGRVRLGGRALARGERVPGAGRLEVLPPEPRAGQGPVPNAAVAVDLRHEDPDVLVVAKPAGLAMHPGPQHGARTLQNALVARFPELRELGRARGFGLVQRLDHDVSGLVVVARTARAHEALVRAFAARQVEKRYTALTLGAPPAPEGTAGAPVDGREARSEWRVRDTRTAGAATVARVELRTLTGRKHQLRVHLAGLGCPILGDKRHGPATLALARRLGVRRVALHAGTLAFAHPVTGAPLRFEEPWPEDLERAWGALDPGEKR